MCVKYIPELQNKYSLTSFASLKNHDIMMGGSLLSFWSGNTCECQISES